ncbi:MAG: outer membrane protein transport protein [Deltaproteobacteria bacterium]|nr:outer membrane protein transport protein [Deltaproteobacteria bacterium]
MKKLSVFGLILSCLFGPMAHGSPVGTIFSSPTTGDAASVYWNPAAMTLLKGHHLMLFGGGSPIWATYQRDVPSPHDGLIAPKADIFMVAPSATIAGVTDAGLDRFRFGFAVSAPLVAGASWKRTYDGRPSPTRYFVEDGYEVTIISQLAAALRINRYLSIGVGLDLYTTLTKFTFEMDFASQINHLACSADPSSCRVDSPLARENPAYDAHGYNRGVGWSVGLTAGLLITPTPWLRFGVGLHTGGGDVGYNVTLFLDVPPAARDFLARSFPSITLPPLEAEFEAVLHIPMIINVGMAIEPFHRLELGLDLEWINESETGLILANLLDDRSGGLIHDIVLVKGKRDYWQTALHARYELTERWHLGGRLEYRPSTRAEEWISPVSVDFSRVGAHFGARWQVLPYLALSLEYSHFFLFDVTVKNTRFGFNPDPTTPEELGLDKPSPTGLYTADAIRLGFGAEFSF